MSWVRGRGSRGVVFWGEGKRPAGCVIRTRRVEPRGLLTLAEAAVCCLCCRLQVTCRKALGDVLERSAFTLRSLLPAPAAS